MPFDFTTPSGLIPKGSAFWGSVVFAKQGGAWGQGSEEGRDTSIFVFSVKSFPIN